MRRYVLGAALLVSGCQLLTGPDEPDRLEDARALWARVGPRDYSFEFTPSCVCHFGGQRIIVTVDDEAVVTARYVGSTALVDAVLLQTIPTIPELFDIIQDAIVRKAHRIEVTYDANYGYPVHAGIDYDVNAIDEEYGFTVTGFTSLQLLATGR